MIEEVGEWEVGHQLSIEHVQADSHGFGAVSIASELQTACDLNVFVFIMDAKEGARNGGEEDAHLNGSSGPADFEPQQNFVLFEDAGHVDVPEQGLGGFGPVDAHDLLLFPNLVLDMFA